MLFVMNILLKVTAAFLAPFIFTLFFILYSIIFDVINGYSPNFNVEGVWFFIVYLYTLPAYLLIGVPISLIIERINKGIQWINYSLAGMVGGLIFSFIINNGSLPLDNIHVTFVVWATAGLSYYVSLVTLKKLVQKLRNKEED